MNDPIASAASIQPTARKNGRPHVVTGPGSGIPSATSESVRNSKEIVAPTRPATTKNSR